MSRQIPATLRAKIAHRANFHCEYCRLPEPYALYPFEVDHIIAIKHGGLTNAENLAYSCMRCNRMKGTDLTTILPGSKEIIPIFNPRTDEWSLHFEVEAGFISGKTKTGMATVRLLEFNTSERIIGRKLLMEAGQYP